MRGTFFPGTLVSSYRPKTWKFESLGDFYVHTPGKSGQNPTF